MNLKASGRTASAGHTWWYNLMTEVLKAPSLGGPTSPMYIKYTEPMLAIYFLLHLPALDKFHLGEKLQSTWATSTLLTNYRHRKISLIFIPKRSIFFFKTLPRVTESSHWSAGHYQDHHKHLCEISISGQERFISFPAKHRKTNSSEAT